MNEIQRTRLQTIYDRLNRIQPEPLNNPESKPHDSQLSGKLAEQLRQSMNRLKAITGEHGQVNYADLATDASYADFQRITDLLPAFDLTSLVSREEKLAFWINLYNVLIMDAIIRYGVKTSILEIRGVFRRVGYNIGGYFFSPDDIEHGILRANSAHPVLGIQFSANDERKKFMLAEKDFRIHFALVCGAESCPPIRFYDPEKIDSQLELATQSFINSSEVEVDIDKQAVRLSKILGWYGVDFGGSRWNVLGWGDKSGVLETIADFRQNPADREFLKSQAKNIQVGYKPYDWSLNHF